MLSISASATSATPFGVAVSGYGPTEGFVYVPDASDNTLKVFDPATNMVEPVEEIDGGETPDGEFVSLRDAAVAIDDFSGDVYLTDNQKPANTESPVDDRLCLRLEGAYEGHLKRNVFDGAPTGLTVDNSASARYPSGTQGRVYRDDRQHPPQRDLRLSAGSGDDRPGTPRADASPPPLGSGLLFPTVAIGGAVSEVQAAAKATVARRCRQNRPTRP